MNQKTERATHYNVVKRNIDPRYEKMINEDILRKLHRAQSHQEVINFLGHLKGWFRGGRLGNVLPDSTRKWIDYLLTHRQAIYYYRKTHPR